MTETTAPAWERFETMQREVHEMLIGAAQCRNHLRAILTTYARVLEDEPELCEDIAAALERLERVGI